MRIGIHDSDQTKFPNLALMKLSASHKNKGDDVSFFEPGKNYDWVYSSKVFTFTSTDPLLPINSIKGGTGYSLDIYLPYEIEHTMPDYSLYNLDYSVGFLTRGCPKKCKHCVVPLKEGDIVPNADITEFLDHNEAVLLDNNVLASKHGITQIEKIAKLGIKIDFNQGLDAIFIDNQIAELLGKVKWRSPIRLACDSMGMMKHVHKAVELLRWNNVTPVRYFCYVLVQDLDDAIERVKFLKGLNVDPFAQPYRPLDGSPINDEHRRFARWVNHKAEFKSRTWEQYNLSHGRI